MLPRYIHPVFLFVSIPGRICCVLLRCACTRMCAGEAMDTPCAPISQTGVSLDTTLGSRAPAHGEKMQHYTHCERQQYEKKFWMGYP